MIRKIKETKVHSCFVDNIWSVDLTDMLLVSKFRKGICFSVCVIDIFRKYTWVILLKDNRGITITINAFQKILDGSNYRPNKIWVDNGSEFYNTSMKFWLEKNDIETYSMHDEEKSFIAERLIETFKNRFTSI